MDVSDDDAYSYSFAQVVASMLRVKYKSAFMKVAGTWRNMGRAWLTCDPASITATLCGAADILQHDSLRKQRVMDEIRQSGVEFHAPSCGFHAGASWASVGPYIESHEDIVKWSELIYIVSCVEFYTRTHIHTHTQRAHSSACNFQTGVGNVALSIAYRHLCLTSPWQRSA